MPELVWQVGGEGFETEINKDWKSKKKKKSFTEIYLFSMLCRKVFLDEKGAIE